MKMNKRQFEDVTIPGQDAPNPGDYFSGNITILREVIYRFIG